MIKKIFGKNNFGSKKVHGQKKMFGRENVWSEKNFARKKFWSEKIFGQRKTWLILVSKLNLSYIELELWYGYDKKGYDRTATQYC